MRIERINIVKYGKFSGFSLELDSYSLIMGDNESGKSTVLSFIYFMLYGKSGSVYENGGAAGSMTVRCGEDKYRIERVLDDEKDRCSIVNVVNGKKCFSGIEPGKALLGISKEEFKAACYLDQQSGRELSSEAIRDAAGALIASQDEKSEIRQIIRTLEDQKLRLENEKLYPLEGEKSSTEEELSRLSVYTSGLLELDGRLKDTESRIKENEKKLDTLSKQTEAYAVKLERKLGEQVGELLRDYEESVGTCAEFREQKQKNGFFPDRAYLENLKELSKNIDECDREVSELDFRIQALDPNSRRGGAKRRHRLGYLFIIGMLLCALAIPAAIVTIFFMSANAVYAAVSAVGTGLIMAFAGLCFKLYHNAKKELVQKSEGRDLQAEIERQNELVGLIAKRNEKENLRASCSMKLCEQYSRWGDSPDTVIDEISGILFEYDKLVSRASALKAELDESERQLAELRSAVPESRADIPLPRDFDVQRAAREYEFITKSNDVLRLKKEELEGRLAEGESLKSRSPAEASERLYTIKEELKQVRQLRSAYDLAISEMRSEELGLDDSRLPELLSVSSDYIARFTGGRYTGIGLARDRRIVIFSSGRQIDVSMISGAMLDIVYLCIRLAAAALMPAKSKPPIILDDCLTRLDDARFETVTRYLGDMSFGGTQVIITATKVRPEDMYGFGVKAFNI